MVKHTRAGLQWVMARWWKQSTTHLSNWTWLPCLCFFASFNAALVFQNAIDAEAVLVVAEGWGDTLLKSSGERLVPQDCQDC